MSYDKSLIAHKLQRWDQYITDYHLPQWESIPDFGLYMDQVVLLLERYLSFIPPVNEEKERIVTASAINNYVRLKLMPAPVKRKYYRVHICYLIMILTLKQSIGISQVQKIIPWELADGQDGPESVRQIYEDYSGKFRGIALLFNRADPAELAGSVRPGCRDRRRGPVSGDGVGAAGRFFQDPGRKAPAPVGGRSLSRPGRRASPRLYRLKKTCHCEPVRRLACQSRFEMQKMCVFM